VNLNLNATVGFDLDRQPGVQPDTRTTSILSPAGDRPE